MAAKIHFETDNAAFDPPFGHCEVARILRALADELDQTDSPEAYHVLRDSNGNRIGEAEIHVYDTAEV